MAKKDAPDVDGGGNAAPVAAAQLRSFMERIERLNQEKADIAADVREVFAEAKGNGFDTKIMRIILKRRAADRAELAVQDALVHTYSTALGMASPADAEVDED